IWPEGAEVALSALETRVLQNLAETPGIVWPATAIAEAAEADPAEADRSVGPVIDRVMYYGSLDTFTLICIAFAVVLLFETAIGHLRRYLVYFVTTRTDVKLWTYTFDKLLNLPIEFFERNSTGELAHNFHEMAKIRNFLITQLFGTALDALVIVFFLPVMFFFSSIMTVCVLVLCVLICGWLVPMLPAIRRHLVAAVPPQTP